MMVRSSPRDSGKTESSLRASESLPMEKDMKVSFQITSKMDSADSNKQMAAYTRANGSTVPFKKESKKVLMVKFIVAPSTIENVTA